METTKDIKIRLEAVSAGGNAFEQVAAGAGKIEKAANQAKAATEGLSSKGLASLKTSLGEVARGSGILDERLMILGRGLAGLGPAAAAAAGPLAVAGAAVVALGSAAIATSPKLQDGLGRALYGISDEAKRATANIQRMQGALMASTSLATTTGFRTSRAEEGGTDYLGPGAQYRISKPFNDTIRDLREQQAGLGDASRAARMFPQAPTAAFDRATALSNAGERISYGLTGPGGLNVGDVTGGLADLRKTVGGGIATPNESRAAYMADQAAKRAQEQQAEADRKLAYAQSQSGAYQAHQGLLGAGVRMGLAQQQVDEGSGIGFGEGFKADFKSGFGLWGKSAIDLKSDKERAAQGNLSAAQQRYAEAEANAAKYGNNTGEGGSTQDVMRARQEALEAAERARNAMKAQLEAQHALNQAKIQGLQTDLQSVSALQKNFETIRKMAQEELNAKKAGLGLMTGEDRLKMLAVSRGVKEGRDLNDEEIEFAKAHSDVFGDALRKQGMKEADANPMIKEILANVGADAKVKQAERAEQEAIKVAAEIRQKIELAVTADEAIAEKLRTELVPRIEDSIKKLLEQLVSTLQQEIAKRFEQKDKDMAEQAANNRQKSGG